MAALFSALNITLIVACILLLIAALVVRDQTGFRVTQLRSELLALRNEQRRLSERRDEIELMVAQIGDAPIWDDVRAGKRMCWQSRHEAFGFRYRHPHK